MANHWPVLFCFTATLVGHGAIANVKTSGFHDRVSTTPGNPGNLLEFGPTGNFCVRCRDRPHWFPVIKLGTRSLI